MIEITRITDDELAVLDWFFDVEWAPESLASLRPLARDEAQLERLRAAVRGLLEKGLVEILQTHDFGPDKPRQLTSNDARTVLAQPRSWALPGEPVFDPHADYYLVAPVLSGHEYEDEAVPAYAAACRERRVEPGSVGALK